MFRDVSHGASTELLVLIVLIEARSPSLFPAIKPAAAVHTPTQSDHFMLFSFMKSSTISKSSFAAALLFTGSQKTCLHLSLNLRNIARKSSSGQCHYNQSSRQPVNKRLFLVI
jgi:hypothetical protein